MEVALAYDANAGVGWAPASLSRRALERGLSVLRPRLGAARQRALARHATALGYASLWTPDWVGMDAFALCRERWRASLSRDPHGIVLGTAVCPMTKHPDPLALARSARELSALTGGRFVLGIGAGSLFYERAAHRPASDDDDDGEPALPNVRAYLIALRDLFAGKPVDYACGRVRLRGARLDEDERPPPPIHLAAIGPRMLRLAGELADGAVLAFCTKEQIAWSRERIAEGARRVGRDAGAVRVSESIAVCIDRDVERARFTLANAMLDVALGPELPLERRRRLGYRAQLERLGFAEPLARLDRLREQGSPRAALVAAVPESMLEIAGYCGAANGAAAALARAHAGLDVAIVRVTAARCSLRSARAVVDACRPSAFEGLL